MCRIRTLNIPPFGIARVASGVFILFGARCSDLLTSCSSSRGRQRQLSILVTVSYVLFVTR